MAPLSIALIENAWLECLAECRFTRCKALYATGTKPVLPDRLVARVNPEPKAIPQPIDPSRRVTGMAPA